MIRISWWCAGCAPIEPTLFICGGCAVTIDPAEEDLQSIFKMILERDMPHQINVKEIRKETSTGLQAATMIDHSPTEGLESGCEVCIQFIDKFTSG